MKSELSQKERDIIACTYFQADMPLRQIAKETGYKEHSIRFALSSLKERGIISNRPYFNPFARGLIEYQTFFKLITPREAARGALSRALADSPLTSYVSFVGRRVRH